MEITDTASEFIWLFSHIAGIYLLIGLAIFALCLTEPEYLEEFRHMDTRGKWLKFGLITCFWLPALLDKE